VEIFVSRATRERYGGVVAQVAPDASLRAPSLIYVVGRLNQGITRELRTLLREWDLSVQEYTSLSVLELRPGLSNAQLARRALVTPQSMLEILAKLESRGLVHRKVDPTHGRVIRNELSKSGRRVLEIAAPEVDQLQDRVFAGLSEAQRKSVTAALSTAMSGLSTRGHGEAGSKALG
jgi:DNA-binding MarR family transcriptional regulator